MIRFFSLVLTTFLFTNLSFAQTIPCGSNESAAHRVQFDVVNLYYEVYDQGPPVLLLHGGLYGYIDEFDSYIAELSKRFTVIAPAMRGHGRSELGSKPFSSRLQADEAVAVHRKGTDQPAVVIGFSHGAKTAYALAAGYPISVRKLVVIGAGPGMSPAAFAWAKGLTADAFARDNGGFVQSRKQLMRKPARWNEFFAKLIAFCASGETLPDEEAKAIRCPVLIIGGDQDFFSPVEVFVQTRAQITNSRLLIVPDCDHVNSLQRPVVLKEFVLPFVTN